MNCTCMTDLEKKLAEKYSADLGKPAEAKCEGVAIVFGKKVTAEHKTPFRIKSDVPGYRKGKEVSFFASFCPFCEKPAHAAEAVDDTPQNYHPV